MRYKLIVLLFLLVLIVGAVFSRNQKAAPSTVTFPSCYDPPNEHYSGPCLAEMRDGVIVGD